MTELSLYLQGGDSTELWNHLESGNLTDDEGLRLNRHQGRPLPGTFALSGAEIIAAAASAAAVAKFVRYLHSWISKREKTAIELQNKKSGVTVTLTREMTEEEALRACTALYSTAQRD